MKPFLSGGARSDAPAFASSCKRTLLSTALALIAAPLAHAADPALSTVVVKSTPFDALGETDLAQPVTVLEGEALQRKLDTNLGNTLSNELGVTTSAFGLAAGRPIIRGLDGPRVRVLDGGIGTLDVSTLSPDHMVTADPLNASQIEILRGPATLLYGSGASGGVVNVVSDRIPSRLYAKPEGSVLLQGSSNTEERTGAFKLRGSAARQFSWSAEGFKRKTSDYDSPSKTIKNSALDSDNVSVGGSFVGERGFMGAAVSRLESVYGVPGTDGTKIDLKQTRYDLAGELDRPLPGFTRLKARVGHNDYTHAEIEGDGEVGTRFKNRGTEGRIEMLHAPISDWRGALGIHVQERDFSAIGDEALVPATHSRSTGLFLVETRKWDAWQLDLGARGERATLNPSGNNPSRAYSLYSASAGGLWKFMDGYGLALSFTHAQRAPTAEELYTKGGPHTATRTYQTGNNALDAETSNNIDLTLRKTAGALKWKVNVFYNRINDYIYERSKDEDGLPGADRVDEDGTPDVNGTYLVQDVAQTDARFYGFEAEATMPLVPNSLDMRLFTDAVRGKLAGGGNVPRIPPQRFGLELNHKAGPWSGSLGVVRALRQDRVSALETSTPGYTLVNAEARYRLPSSGWGQYSLFVQGKNLLDEDIRVHSSYLKDVAPLPGRAFVAGIRGEF